MLNVSCLSRTDVHFNLQGECQLEGKYSSCTMWMLAVKPTPAITPDCAVISWLLEKSRSTFPCPPWLRAVTSTGSNRKAIDRPATPSSSL